MIVLFSALMYLGIWVQLSLLHWAAAFRRWEMWGPVFVTPAIVAAAVLAGVQREGIPGWIGAIGLSIGVLEGAAGLYFHLTGVVAQVGGLTLRNLMVGPPPVLPMAYSLVGALGLIGLVWHG